MLEAGKQRDIWDFVITGGGFNCQNPGRQARNYTPENLTIEDIASKYIEKVKPFSPRASITSRVVCWGTTALRWSAIRAPG